MKAKEKAEELFDKINIHIPIEASFNHTGKQALEKMTIDHLATKKIVLISVDEMIEVIGYFDSQYGSQIFKDEINFWEEVKEEIEKL